MMHREQLPRASTRGNDESRPFIELMYSTGWNSIQAGYPPKMLQEVMGNASITTTLDLYGHLYPGDMDRYADRLDDAAADAGKAKIRPDDGEDTQGTT